MAERDPTTPSVELIDEQTTFTLAELCRCCAVEAELIEALVEHGILEPVGRYGHHWRFPSSSLRRTRITIHLQRDLGVNLAGAALALDLLERLEALDARLRAIKGDRLP
ncbi:chaperone modulator CbpM [Thioalbus denitrificans]|uniref:Chaperone modulatory protein CbpM n=1 Tax=Thioalbus denitrificans TaxID=547122 RepID=A0A369CJW6_9GAMM|nr:chaperone modulator CbpM [Thioalbus denitrificans]RCX32737.1 chaperone modulatory protein CbpM [Thioalbus denitrificans]